MEKKLTDQGVSQKAAKGEANNSGLKKDFNYAGTSKPKPGSIDKNVHGDGGSRGGQ